MKTSCEKEQSGFALSIQLFTLYLLVYGSSISFLFPAFRDLINILRVFMAAITLSIEKKIPITYSRSFDTLITMIISIILMCISYIYTNDIEFGGERFIICAPTIFFMLVIYLISKKITIMSLRSFLKKTLKFNTFIMLIFFFLHFGSFLNCIRSGGRFGDDLGKNPIWIARICGEQILLLFVLSKWKLIQSKKILFLFLLIICFATGSKGPIFSVIIIGISYYISISMLMSRKIAILISATILSVLFVFLLNNLLSIPILNRFSNKSVESATSVSNGSRASMYLYTLNAIPEKLLFGHGLGSWTNSYWSIYGVSAVKNSYPHNILLEMLFECGLITTFFWVFSIIKIKKYFKKYKYSVVYSFYLILLLNIFYGMFSGSIIDGNRGIYYFFSICCALI